MPTKLTPKFITISEVAGRAGVTRQWIQQLVA